jgi:calcineurin-like phosphoesterase family protein
MEFFISDLHLGHENIIKYANRPFKNADEMNEAMVNNWNSVVSKDDKTFVVGDLALCPPRKACNLIRRMNGLKFLVPGNHDWQLLDDEEFNSLVTVLPPLHEISVSDSEGYKGRRNIVLCHYSMRVWNKSHHGSYHLYGHSHGRLRDDPNSLSFDVGVDCHNFTPISYARVREIMSKKTWTSPHLRGDNSRYE